MFSKAVPSGIENKPPLREVKKNIFLRFLL